MNRYNNLYKERQQLTERGCVQIGYSRGRQVVKDWRLGYTDTRLRSKLLAASRRTYHCEKYAIKPPYYSL